MTDTKRNLHLQFRYTTLGGKDVYEIFDAEDNKRLSNPLGTANVLHTLGPAGEAVASVWVEMLPTPAEDAAAAADAAAADAKDRTIQLELDLRGGA